TGWTIDGWSGSTSGSPAPIPSGCWPATAAWCAAARRSPQWTVSGQVERAALAETPAGTLLEVVMEPTGPAWLPIAVFFAARGHTVYRVSSGQAHDQPRGVSRH